MRVIQGGYNNVRVIVVVNRHSTLDEQDGDYWLACGHVTLLIRGIHARIPYLNPFSTNEIKRLMVDRLVGMWWSLLCFVLHVYDVRAFFLFRQRPVTVGAFAERWTRNPPSSGTGFTYSSSDMSMQMTKKSSSNRNGKSAQTQTETVSAYGIDIPVPLSTRSSLKCEVDYLGMINFCLRKTDTALSGSSKSKMLNAISNEVFRAIMIAHEPRVDTLSSKFHFFREQLGGTKCYLDANNMISLVPPPKWDPNTLMKLPPPGDDDNAAAVNVGDVYTTDSAASMKYLSALEGLLKSGQKRTQPIGDATYDTGYSRLVTLLREAGCRFENDDMGDEGLFGESGGAGGVSKSGGGSGSGSGVNAPPVGASGLRVLAGALADLPDGQRTVLDTHKGAVIVTNQGGQLYAVNAKCPHLGLPMKTGDISPDANGAPILTCKFHNSKFNLEDGKCVTWCSGVMGIPGTENIAGAMGKFGGKEKSPATVYPVEVEGGQVYVQLEAPVLASTDGMSVFDPLGMTVNVPVVGRPRPMDSRICLSLMDNAMPPGGKSKTRELNIVANCVSRAMLYGTKADKDELAVYLDEMARSFPDRWVVAEGAEGQEVRFVRALSLLLRSGLTAAAEATTFLGGPSDWLLRGDVDVSARTSASASVASGASTVPTSFDVATTSVIGVNAELSANDNTIPTLSLTKRGMQLSMPAPPLRLYDTYQNAFQRVIDSCFREISTRGGLIPPSTNDELLMAFVLWEQSLRRNITDGIWQQNPTELVGTWELVDVAGQGSLEPILTAAASDFYFGMKQGVSIV